MKLVFITRPRKTEVIKNNQNQKKTMKYDIKKIFTKTEQYLELEAFFSLIAHLVRKSAIIVSELGNNQSEKHGIRARTEHVPDQ